VYQEQPVQIMDSKDRVTQNWAVRIYKVLWSHHYERDATWEMEAYLREVYPAFHKKWLVTQILGWDFYKGGRAVTPLVLSLHFMCISIICAFAFIKVKYGFMCLFKFLESCLICLWSW
jgi:hypothetical protein